MDVSVARLAASEVRRRPVSPTIVTMPRLRTVSPSSAGWTRRRAGRGFTYTDADGTRLPSDDALRCKALVIPPAWEELWICPYPNGHIQAVGTDVAGRRQYLYHPAWRLKRDAAKHDRVLTVAARLPKAREQVAVDLALEGMPAERALATAFRLLDLGFFRIGGESYAEENESYGLATLLAEHVTISDHSVEFEYAAKSGRERLVTIADDDVLDAVRTLKRRRGGGPGLFAYRDGRRWHDVTSGDINAYVKDVVGGEVSAKDFRTWHATVLAAVALAVSAHAGSPTARKRAVVRAMKEVAEYLGNTPAVARASYVDPRVVDLFSDGHTIEHALRRLGEGAEIGHPATHGAVERATLALLRNAPRSRTAR
ncbi:MAG TPA: DNA topoisomerase IB [Actinomycetales bacterium]|nr:DNA topoisomerase IB [Actinomycetales bacterium]